MQKRVQMYNLLSDVTYKVLDCSSHFGCPWKNGIRFSFNIYNLPPQCNVQWTHLREGRPRLQGGHPFHLQDSWWHCKRCSWNGHMDQSSKLLHQKQRKLCSPSLLTLKHTSIQRFFSYWMAHLGKLHWLSPATRKCSYRWCQWNIPDLGNRQICLLWLWMESMPIY